MNDTATQPTFQVNLPAIELGKGECEYRAFLRLLPELLKTHRGKFVAIHDERVVDADADDITLVERVRKNVGYVPVHVGVVEDPQPIYRIPIYRECRPGGDSK